MDDRDAAAEPRQDGSARAALRTIGLHKSFGSLHVLKGIDFAAWKGEVVSIIGGSGSGKSTFLRCLNLLELPSSGSIEIGGEPLPLDYRGGQPRMRGQKRVEQARARIGMVFQSFNLWPHMTVMKNLSIGPVTVKGLSKGEARERAEGYLDKVGVLDKRDAYPAHLSGGQQQRVAIARALCMEPEILLFDEPTSALDPELVGEVLGVMRVLAGEGRTMVVVTHEMAFARDVSARILFFDQGLVAEQGTPREIFQAPRAEALRRFIGA